MTWMIFCSLALCAFQIVFAEKLAEEIAASLEKSTVPIMDANGKAYADISNVADTVNIKEISTDQIYNKCTSMSIDADKKIDDIYETKMDKCKQCYGKAKNTKDIQTAENCCKQIAEEFKKVAKSYTAQAKTCIADLVQKCAKSATYCRKEAKNADKLAEEMEKKEEQKYRNWLK